MKEKLKNFACLCFNKYRKVSALAMAFFLSVMVTGVCNAQEESGNVTSGMTTAMTTAFNGVKTDVTSIITTALPPALAIMGIVIAISIGVKFFRRFAK